MTPIKRYDTTLHYYGGDAEAEMEENEKGYYVSYHDHVEAMVAAVRNAFDSGIYAATNGKYQIEDGDEKFSELLKELGIEPQP